jgi:hypothetical protein
MSRQIATVDPCDACLIARVARVGLHIGSGIPINITQNQ